MDLDIDAHIDEIEKTTGVRPDTAYIGEAAWEVLKNHPQLRSLLGGKEPVPDDLLNLFGIKSVSVKIFPGNKECIK